MSMESSWEAAFDRARIQDPEQRERIRAAFAMAQELLEPFRGRIRWVVARFEEYSAEECRLPLEVVVGPGDDGWELEWELSRRVFGPVLKATRLSLPVTLLSPAPEGVTARPPAGTAIVYPPAA